MGYELAKFANDAYNSIQSNIDGFETVGTPFPPPPIGPDILLKWLSVSIYADNNNRRIIIAFKGTKTFPEWGSNIKFWQSVCVFGGKVDR